MISVAAALLSALTFGLSAVLVRKKLEESNFFSVAFVVTFIGNIILWPIALLSVNLKTFNFDAAIFFVVAGILAPGMARLFYYKGMEAVGVQVNAAVFATYPLYSSILAVLLLNETLILENWIGIICIIIGVVFIERSLGKPETKFEKISKKGLIFSLLTALVVALSYIARKHALNIYNEPLLGVAIGYTLSLIVVTVGYKLTSTFTPTMRDPMFSDKDFRLFWKPSVCLSLAWFLAFYALSHERVSIITPLIQTEPLFVIFFAYLYLRELEHLSVKLVLGTALIVIGVTFISATI